MSAISTRIKQCLADLEAAGKALAAVDADCAELAAVGTLLDARRSELAGVEAAIARAQEAFAKDDAAHADWRQKAAMEKSSGNAEIDRIQERLRELQQQVSERRAEHDGIVAGLAALSQRLRVG